MPDPRRRCGRRYRIGPLLGLCLVAVLGGARSLAGISRFARSADPDLLVALGLPARAERIAASTLGRLLARLDGDALDAAAGRYLAGLAMFRPPGERGPVGLAVDGKTLRGSRTGDRGAIHLLAAALHEGQLVIAQRQIEAKSNEIPAFAPLISGLDLTGTVVTADALHTQTDHAVQVVTAGADYLFIAKGNQPTLHRQLKHLPWQDIPLNDRRKETGHGRGEIRRLKACTVQPGLLFPHAAQAIQIKRRRTDRKTKKTTITTVYAVTSLKPGRITASRLA